MNHTYKKHPKEQWGGGTIADSTLHNKLFYQLSTFTKAFSQFINNQGYDSNDTDLSTLLDNLTKALQKYTYTNLTASTSNDSTYQLDGMNIHILKEPNGYAKLGDQYGQLLIQWGNQLSTVVSGYYEFPYPIEFTENPFIVICDEASSEGWGNSSSLPGTPTSVTITSHDSGTSTKSTCRISTRWITDNGNGSMYMAQNGNHFNYIAIGY